MSINSKSTKQEIYVAFQQVSSEVKALEHKLLKAENLHTVALAEIASNDADLAELKFYKQKAKDLDVQVGHNLAYISEQRDDYLRLKRHATAAILAAVFFIIGQTLVTIYL